jgi:hypothetical protein
MASAGQGARLLLDVESAFELNSPKRDFGRAPFIHPIGSAGRRLFWRRTKRAFKKKKGLKRQGLLLAISKKLAADKGPKHTTGFKLKVYEKRASNR